MGVFERKFSVEHLQILISKIQNMVSKLVKEHDRRTLLADYLYGVSNLLLSGTGIGGFSPLITGDAIGVYNILFLAFGIISALGCAYCANSVMKYNDSKI